MRDRLIELINFAHNGVGAMKNRHKTLAEIVADYLLENGVIVPPCKINDDLYWIDFNNRICKQEQAIKGIMFQSDGKDHKWFVSDSDGEIDEIGSAFACLTREDAERLLEEAENALKGGAEE